MFIADRLTIGDKRRTSDGYLVTTARFARSGLYEYSGAEVGKPNMEKVTVYRPEDEVFSERAMASFAHKPITNEHPPENVSAHSWKEDAVGFTDGRVARDGDFIAIPMMVADLKAIEDIEGGKRELSAGYECDLEFVDGEAQDGSHYDAVMRNIRGNHIAIVGSGRAGSECRISDSGRGVRTMKIMFDGIEIEATDQSAQAITKLQDKLTSTASAHAIALAAKDTEIAAKDAEIGKKDQEIADLKGKVLDAAALDKRVADRAALVSNARKLVADLDCSGKGDGEIKRAVVAAKCGDAAVKDKSDAYVDARFDALLEASGGSDTVREAILSGQGGNVSSFDAARAAQDADKALDDANDLNRWRAPKSA